MTPQIVSITTVTRIFSVVFMCAPFSLLCLTLAITGGWTWRGPGSAGRVGDPAAVTGQARDGANRPLNLVVILCPTAPGLHGRRGCAILS